MEINMAKKIVIFPLSLYLDNQQAKSKAEFIRLGVNRFSLSWHFMPLPSFLNRFRGLSLPTIFDQYRRGELTTNNFRNQIRAKFPGINISDSDFDKAWNAMQVVTDKTHDALKEAKDLNNKGVNVYTIVGTNSLHFADLKKKAKILALPGTSHLSFQKKQLGRDLFASLLAKIRTDHSGIRKEDIIYFYSQPRDPYPRLGKLAWLWDPVKKYEYYAAKNYVASLQREAAGPNGFTLVECQATQTKANIKSTLENRGWLAKKTAQQEKAKPAVTYALHSRGVLPTTTLSATVNSRQPNKRPKIK